jgi:hypothetical protein
MKFTADTWIALASVVVAVLSAIYTAVTSRRLTRLQVELAEYDLRERRATADLARRADLQLRLESGPDRFVLSNVGGAVARDVHLEVNRANGGPDPIELARRRKLPLARLDPGEHCELGAAIYREYESAPFECVITWRDPDGSRQRAERTVHT